MSGNKYLKAGIGYTVGNYLLKGLTFLTMPIFARLLSTAEYGQYSVFVTYEAMLFVVLGFAIHSSYKNAFYRYGGAGGVDSSEYNKYVSSTMLLILASTGFWLIISIVFRDSLSTLLGMDRIVLPLLVLFSYASAMINCFNADVGLRYEYGKFLLVSFINAISNIAMSLLLILTVFSEQRGLGRIIGATVPAIIISGVLTSIYLKRARPEGVKEKLTWGIRYSLPIIPHGLSQIVLNQFDRIMILHMIGAATAGIYSFAYNVYMIVSVTATSVDNVWAPWFYERMKEENLGKIKRVSSVYLLFLLTLCICVTQAGPELIWILGGEKYAESVYYVIPIVTSGVFAFAYNIPVAVEYYHEKTANIAIATITAALVNIVLNFIFIRQFGAVAAAYTTLFTYFLYFFFHLFMSYRIEGRMLFDIRIILFALIIAIVNNFCVIVLLPYPLFRLLIICSALAAIIVYEEKEFGYIKKKREGRHSHE